LKATVLTCITMVQLNRRGLRTRLSADYVPGEHTVLCGRGKEYTASPGNRQLKSLVLKYLKPYSEAKSKIAKSSIVSDIIGQVKSICSDVPAFVKLENDAWFEVDDAFAREKIGTLRAHSEISFLRTIHSKLSFRLHVS
jgi:hypothetical protein